VLFHNWIAFSSYFWPGSLELQLDPDNWNYQEENGKRLELMGDCIKRPEQKKLQNAVTQQYHLSSKHQLNLEGKTHFLTNAKTVFIEAFFREC